MYSSYFCQQLFFLVDSNIKEQVLQQIFDNFITLMKFENGIYSVICILENELSSKEKAFVIDKISVMLSRENCFNPGFLRVAECILCSFSVDLTLELQHYTIREFNNLVKTKEGYFLIRAYIKTCKDSLLQLKFIQLFYNDFDNFAKTKNGSLICQCIIYNFPLKYYIHLKTCSKHIKADKEDRSKQELIEYNNKNKATRYLCKLVLEKLIMWNNAYFYSVIDCVFKHSQGIITKVFMKLIKKEDFTPISIILEHMGESEGFSILNDIFYYFDIENGMVIADIIKEKYLEKVTVKAQKKHLKQMLKVALSKNKAFMTKSKITKSSKDSDIEIVRREKNKTTINSIQNQPFDSQILITSNNLLYPYPSQKVMSYSIPQSSANYLNQQSQYFPNYYQGYLINPTQHYSQLTQSTQGGSNYPSINSLNYFIQFPGSTNSLNPGSLSSFTQFNFQNSFKNNKKD